MRMGDAMKVREYTDQDLTEIIRIWNEVVEEGVAFPQEETLDKKSGAEFFASQSYTGVAEENGKIYGLYILHPKHGRASPSAAQSECCSLASVATCMVPR